MIHKVVLKALKKSKPKLKNYFIAQIGSIFIAKVVRQLFSDVETFDQICE